MVFSQRYTRINSGVEPSGFMLTVKELVFQREAGPLVATLNPLNPKGFYMYRLL
jgi:hypothetical protein